MKVNVKVERHDKAHRGMQHARGLRNACLKSLADRFVADPSRGFARRSKRMLAGRIEALPRSSFNSII